MTASVFTGVQDNMNSCCFFPVGWDLVDSSITLKMDQAYYQTGPPRYLSSIKVFEKHNAIVSEDSKQLHN